MKVLQLLIVSALAVPIYGQTIDKDVQSLKVENLDDFSTYLDETVSFIKDDDPQVLAKEEVVKELASFITSNKLTKIPLQHSSSRGYHDHRYIIGKVRGNAAQYRLFFNVETEGESQQITEIRINRV